MALLVGPALLIASSPQCADDPWPFWQRTPSRLGRTLTIGPRKPVLAWRVRVDLGQDYIALESSPVMDGDARLFVGTAEGVTAVDTRTGTVLWEFPTEDHVNYSPAYWGGKVFFGSADDHFYCVDAEKGTPCWSMPAAPHPLSSPVVDQGGNVYFATYEGIICARRAEDGSEVWTRDLGDSSYSSPSLDGQGRLLIGNDMRGQWLALSTATGETLWTCQMDLNAFGVSPVEWGRVYVACRDGNLYCINARTGKEIWRFPRQAMSTGAVATGYDGTVYYATVLGNGRLYAVTPEGDEKWTYVVGHAVKYAPIVDGAGTVYLCSYLSPKSGEIHAVNPDGTALWVYEMPDYVTASPMLGPDGTLYVVCKDKYLSAFRDWQVAVPKAFCIPPGGPPDSMGDGDGLAESDDEYLIVGNRLPFLTSRPTVLETWATLNSSSLGRLDITVEGHTSGVSYQQLELFNFWANRWEVIDFGPCSLVDETITIEDIPNPSAYVNPEDNRIVLRITNWPTGFALRPFPFTTYLDHIEFRVKFQ